MLAKLNSILFETLKPVADSMTEVNEISTEDFLRKVDLMYKQIREGWKDEKHNEFNEYMMIAADVVSL